ncbi:hypothetical protein BD780_002119 [Clostridium tetanomorphum]|uniref:Uncharacterized protein n=1 Tax=Clostridium tetanomorphum TaxID=1553 RepID=A0A923IZ16_CLOTT|nr:hypothetical protein [Clostridium tetanomorphum]KAJ49708.1 hypothetical protein CTM_21733 [Clostridium tetanomorphum DSM 665]KAJ51591.1 hypothetical protein CTM_11970 [Clostridium tetanomorphum DSM 665]MBC2396492.1 hypothetical protein [Clostridium tetanomorphum]MBP1863816.1 hypothetical protein [Clostridium tetanomorphum]NRS84894.1 hypothetical protein [Clostridium tetanomorphum]
MVRDKIKSCMIGESIFKIGDYTSLAQGWNLYKHKLSLEECTVLKIIDLYYVKDENYLPKFRAILETNKGNVIDVQVSDLNDVRNSKENREELNKIGYDFEKGCIYCKGYEELSGKWKFFDIGVTENNAYCETV